MNHPDPKSARAHDLPLQLAADQEDDREMDIDPPKTLFSDELNGVADATDTSDNGTATPPVAAERSSITDALRWALDCLQEPAMASADWLARDIDPNAVSAAALLSDPQITLGQVRQAKTVFKTMRIVGEKSADRRIGGRMYAAAIAAGLVRHNTRISSQSNAALKRAFKALLDDRQMPQPLRDLAGMAMCVIEQHK